MSSSGFAPNSTRSAAAPSATTPTSSSRSSAAAFDVADAHRLERRHPPLDHADDLEQRVAVRVERRPGVGPARDPARRRGANAGTPRARARRAPSPSRPRTPAPRPHGRRCRGSPRSSARGTSPRSFISRAPSAESIEPCSIESTPARTARMMPSGPIACAPTTRPHECASSTAASSSSCVNAVKSWVIPGVSTPPVATSLIAVAPARISSRTARRSASGPSTSRANPTLCPWPPVIVSAWPAARILGPAMRPSLDAERPPGSPSRRARPGPAPSSRRDRAFARRCGRP